MNLTKIDKAHIIAAIGSVGSVVIAIVPSWSSEVQAIVAASGIIVSNLYPIVKAIEKAADSNVSARDVEAGAIDAAKTEIGKVDFDKLVQDAVAAQSVLDLEAKAKAAAQAELQALLARLGAPAPVAPVQVAQAPTPAA